MFAFSHVLKGALGLVEEGTSLTEMSYEAARSFLCQ